MLLTLRNVPLPDAQQQGALPPPPGIIPNFASPSSIARSFQVGFGVCVGISGLFVITRTYARICVMKRWGLDDYLMWCSWILSVGYIVTSRWAMPYGAGVHQWNVDVIAFLEFKKHWNVPMILYNPAICCIKLAILLQLLAIFTPASSPKLHRAFVSLIIVNMIFYTTCFFLRIFQCIPRQKIWDPKLPGSCIRVQTTVIASASLNVVLDFVMLLLPITKIWQLQISKCKKAAISVVFGTGFLGCVASIMRLITSLHLNSTKDSTHDLLLVGVWCEVEITSGLICYCLSVFPQLYRQCVKKMFSGPSASHTYSHRGVLPPHNFYKRHFDSLHGGRNLKPFQGGHSSLSKTYRIDFDESGVAETMETEFPGQHRSQTSSLK